MTDEDSRIMKVAGGGFDQCYNAQAVVAAGSLLVLANAVTQAGRKLYGLRKQIPEPVFGIIKSNLLDGRQLRHASRFACYHPSVAESCRLYLWSTRFRF